MARIPERELMLAATQQPISLALASLPASSASALYVVGGQQRTPRTLMDQAQQWYDYKQGVIVRVDLMTGQVTRRLEYTSPAGVCAPNDPVLFKSASVDGDKLYACTQTEVMVWQLPDFTRITHISLPCFNDVHHVRPLPTGNLLVAVSGLDMVIEVNPRGEMVREWDVLDGQPWSRFAPEIDYRQGISTKPHRAHPNHLAIVRAGAAGDQSDGEDEVWVTRFEQRDAICLGDPSRVIAIGTERVHDGFWHEGRLYFTTVDGTIVIANPATLQVEQTIDLTTMHEAETLLGWCRGLWVEGRMAWVGFSRIRPTKFREAVSWVRTGFKPSCPTHIACYDLVDQRCLAEIELEEFGVNAVFSILPTAIEL